MRRHRPCRFGGSARPFRTGTERHRCRGRRVEARRSSAEAEPRVDCRRRHLRAGDRGREDAPGRGRRPCRVDRRRRFVDPEPRKVPGVPRPRGVPLPHRPLGPHPVRRTMRAYACSGRLAVVATFAPDGPEACSGLPVSRYDARGLADQCGPGFELIDDERHVHTTRRGARQRFVYASFLRVARSREPSAADVPVSPWRTSGPPVPAETFRLVQTLPSIGQH